MRTRSTFTPLFSKIWLFSAKKSGAHPIHELIEILAVSVPLLGARWQVMMKTDAAKAPTKVIVKSSFLLMLVIPQDLLSSLPDLRDSVLAAFRAARSIRSHFFSPITLSLKASRMSAAPDGGRRA